MEINFKANLITKPTIIKKGRLCQKYKPIEVSFVRLDTQSIRDINLLKKLKKMWPLTFVSNICKDVSLYSNLFTVYALTTQQDNFEKLSPNKILGLAEITNEQNEISLEYLQTHPKYEYDENVKERKFKKIGNTMLDCIKNLEHVKKIYTNSLFSIIPFYEKNGFKPDTKNEARLCWEKE